jgi:hypothetical protein
MSLKFKDGFDYWGNIGNTPIHSDWTLSDPSSINTSSSYAFMGTPVFDSGKYIYLIQNAVTLTRSFTAGSSFVSGFHFRLRGNDQAHPFLSFRDAGSTQLKFVVNTSYYIEVYRNTTLLGTSSAPISLGRWHFIETKFTINNSTGTVQVKIDEVSVLNLTSQDTQETGNATVDSMQFLAAPGNYSGREMGLDNLYLLDTSGGSLNDFLGEIRIVGLAPNAAGSTTSWTPLSGLNYAAVDDIPHDVDSTYVETTASGNYDFYNCPTFSAEGTIHAFSVISLAKKTTADPATLKNSIRQSSVNYDGSSNTLTTSYIYYTDTYLVDPNTTVAWTNSGIDAAQIGIKVA